MPVLPDQPSMSTVAYDLMIVATLEHVRANQVARLIRDGVPKEKLFPLRQERSTQPHACAELARSANGQHG